MKLTSSFKPKGTFRRTRSYSNDVKQPEISNPKATIKSTCVFDEGVMDLTDEVELTNIMIEQLEKSTMKSSDVKQLRKDIVLDIVEGISDIGKKLPVSNPKQTTITKNGSSICVLLSDWHFGKVIKTRSGKFIYNSEIAINRVENTLTEAVSSYCKTMSAGHKIDELVFIFAGDIVDNDIVYDTQRFRIDTPVGLQFHNVIRSIIVMIEKAYKIISEFNSKAVIKLECVVGNHGRPSATSKIGVCSWDTAVYSAIDLALKCSPLAKVATLSFGLEDYKVINVRGWRGLITHHAPPQSETPSAKKKFGGWNEIFDFDFCCYGDLHHWAASSYNGKPLLMNGSLCGYDEFAIKIGVRDEWTQLIWTATDVDPVTYLQKIKEN